MPMPCHVLQSNNYLQVSTRHHLRSWSTPRCSEGRAMTRITSVFKHAWPIWKKHASKSVKKKMQAMLQAGMLCWTRSNIKTVKQPLIHTHQGDKLTKGQSSMIYIQSTYLGLTSWPPCDNVQKPSGKLLETITGCYQDTGRGPGSAACPMMLGKNGLQVSPNTVECHQTLTASPNTEAPDGLTRTTSKHMHNTQASAQKLLQGITHLG